jgi:hypothetical protein
MNTHSLSANRSAHPALIAAASAIALSICAKASAQLAVVPATPTVTYDLGTDTAAAGVAAAAATWGTDGSDADMPANQLLLGVGNGFPTLTNAAGVAMLPGGPTGTQTSAPAGVSATINSGNQAIAAPAPAGSTAGANLAAKALGGGGGVIWSGPTFANSGASGNANYVVSASSGTITLINNGAAVAGRSMLLWGASGYIPFGGLGEVGLTGTVSINGGAPAAIADGPIIVGVHAGAANVAAGTNDFVEAGSAPARFVAAPIGANVNANWFYSPVTANAVDGEYLAEQNDPNGLGIDFAFWTLSASGLFNLNNTNTIMGTVSATIISDPGADIMFNLAELPSSDDSDDDGFDPGSPTVPEPASASLLGLSGLVLLLRRRRA